MSPRGGGDRNVVAREFEDGEGGKGKPVSGRQRRT